MTACPIASVEAIPLRAPTVDAADLDSSSETVVVRVVDEEGRAGIGEADAPAVAVRELVEMPDAHAWSRGVAGMLVGRDPFAIAALSRELYEGTIWHGRRGLGIHVLSAVDIALHDLVGKQLGRPAYQLLGGACRIELTPYATVYPGAPGGRTIGELMDAIAGLFERALALGFRAVKMEVIFDDLVSDRRLVECIREGRRLLGDDVTMMLDFGYRWHDWREALWVLSRVADCDVYFAEATLQHDDLTGHAKLARAVETRVCGAEMAATVHECREWLRTGGVDVLQPDPGRCGGLTELRRIAELAALEGALVVPHGWKTGITAAASRHFQAATPNAPFIESFHPELFPSPLRAELVDGEPRVADGAIALPEAPGLGVELSADAVERYRIGNA
ncbi:MAG TPA: mandelate racemase/muconate lactonizing enzyme family protein [Gaiellaceae bacterium]